MITFNSNKTAVPARLIFTHWLMCSITFVIFWELAFTQLRHPKYELTAFLPPIPTHKSELCCRPVCIKMSFIFE